MKRSVCDVEEGELPLAPVLLAPQSSCTHTVALPPGAPPLQPDDPLGCLPIPESFDAMQFPFPLDRFQQKVREGGAG